jgi:hypothetical protein
MDIFEAKHPRSRGNRCAADAVGCMPAAALEYDSIMGRRLHMALGVWFLIATTIAQGCAGPAQNASAYNARNATTTAATASRNGAAGASANASRANTHINAQGYVSDPNASAALTDYFKHHRLPLVGAQVLRNPNDGSRAVVLYGFVGSDFGKSDAQRQAEDFINDASVDVDNRIRVNPDLLTARTPADAASSVANDPDAQEQANASASMPGVQNYVDQQNQASQLQQYQQQNSMSGMNSMMPLIALLGILSMEMAATGGGYSSGPHFGYSSPYGNSPYGSPYSPYPGYASPGLSPYGYRSPGYGSSGGSSSPDGGGVTPFGSSPGSPYYSSP